MRQEVSNSSQGQTELTSKDLFGVICFIMTLIWPWSLFSISVLCSATSLAMSEDCPKVRELAADDWMLPQKPKSITVQWKSPAHLCRSIVSTLWKLWALQAFRTLLPGSLTLAISTSSCWDLGHSRSMALWCSGHPHSLSFSQWFSFSFTFSSGAVV